MRKEDIIIPITSREENRKAAPKHPLLIYHLVSESPCCGVCFVSLAGVCVSGDVVGSKWNSGL